MSRRLPAPDLLTPVLSAAAVLAIAAVLASGTAFGAGLRWGLYLVAAAVVVLDSLDLVLRLWWQRGWTRPGPTVPLPGRSLDGHQRRLHAPRWAVVLSVHELGAEVEEVARRLEPFRDVVWTIDDASRDETAERLRHLGFRCLRADENRKKPGALQRLLATLPPEIEVVVVLDPDCEILGPEGRVRDDLEERLYELTASGAAALAPRIAVRDDGTLARLQGLEYLLSTAVGRRGLGPSSVTSGACIYRRRHLEEALALHTGSVYAEDLENAVLLLGRGETIYCDDRVVIETEGKRTLGGWFSQRVGWSYGLLRVVADRAASLRRIARRSPIELYQFVVYFGLLMLALHPVRIASLVLLTGSFVNGLDAVVGLGWIPDHPAIAPAFFVVAWTKYTALVAVAVAWTTRGPERWRHLLTSPIYFLYVLLLVVPTTVGYLNWIWLRWKGRRLYVDHYHDDDAAVGGRRGATV